MKVIMIDMLYEWTANMIKTHAKEVNNAIEKRRKIHGNLKKEIKKVQANKYPVIKLHKTRENKEEERTSDSTEDVSENPVFAHPV
jgi:exonuclease I